MFKISKIIDDIPSEAKLAIWGTGHHASMLYANTNLKSKNIVAILDSDPKKKDMDMFGMKIKPFDDEMVLNGEIDTILIASYTAQNAIKNAIEKKKLPVNIVLLY